jgi:hypothetical protein
MRTIRNLGLQNPSETDLVFLPFPDRIMKLRSRNSHIGRCHRLPLIWVLSAVVHEKGIVCYGK